MIWNLLKLISIILLILYFRAGRNAVWGGFTMGVIVVIILIFFFDVPSYVYMRILSISVLAGFGADLLGRLSDKLRERGW